MYWTLVRVTFHHLVGWLQAHICDPCCRKLFLVGFVSRWWGICGQREGDAEIGHQFGQEFIHISIQIWGKQWWSTQFDLPTYSGYVLYMEVSMTGVIDGLIVNPEGTIGPRKDQWPSCQCCTVSRHSYWQQLPGLWGAAQEDGGSYQCKLHQGLLAPGLQTLPRIHACQCLSHCRGCRKTHLC